jgi:hypothetical protein
VEVPLTPLAGPVAAGIRGVVLEVFLDKVTVGVLVLLTLLITQTVHMVVGTLVAAEAVRVAQVLRLMIGTEEMAVAGHRPL